MRDIWVWLKIFLTLKDPKKKLRIELLFVYLFLCRPKQDNYS